VAEGRLEPLTEWMILKTKPDPTGSGKLRKGMKRFRP
jgi:hypothetical protein